MPILYDHRGKPASKWSADGRLLWRDSEYALPPHLTTAALYQSAYRTFLHEKWDEALSDQRVNALAMWRNGWLWRLVGERIDGFRSLKWQIEVDDQKDPVQKGVADHMTKAFKRIPMFRAFLYQQGLSRWFGRGCTQFDFLFDGIDGRKTLLVDKHVPIHGDLINHQWDGTPYILVNAAHDDDIKEMAGGKIRPADTITTNIGGRGLLLRGGWRERFCLSYFNREPPDFFEGDKMGGLWGVGLRSKIYFLWYYLEEFIGWIVDHLERSGMGIVLVKYDQGSAEAKTQAEAIAKNYDRRTVITVPVPPGSAGGVGRFQGGAYGIEVVETPLEGVRILWETLIQDREEKIERVIIGQTMSGGRDSDDSGGLGDSGHAKMATSTKAQIIAGDAIEIGEDITNDLLKTMVRYTFGTLPFGVRFVFQLEDEDPEKKLQAGNTAVQMGCKLKMDEVREAAGFSKPEDGDETVGGQQMGMDPNAPPGADPSADTDAPLDDSGMLEEGEPGDEVDGEDADEGDETESFLEYLAHEAGSPN